MTSLTLTNLKTQTTDHWELCSKFMPPSFSFQSTAGSVQGDLLGSSPAGLHIQHHPVSQPVWRIPAAPLLSLVGRCVHVPRMANESVHWEDEIRSVRSIFIIKFLMLIFSTRWKKTTRCSFRGRLHKAFNYPINEHIVAPNEAMVERGRLHTIIIPFLRHALKKCLIQLVGGTWTKAPAANIKPGVKF